MNPGATRLPLAGIAFLALADTAIVALAFYNYLNVKIGLINNSFARACERLVQALLYVESSAQPPAPARAQETGHGHPLPA